MRNRLVDMLAWPVLAAMLILTLACGTESVTGPSPETRVPSSAPSTLGAPVAITPPAPVTVPHVGTITGASFKIENNSGTYALYVARIYSVAPGGGQSLHQELFSGNVASGESWGGTFTSLPCNYQIDLDHQGPVTHPAPGYLGSKIVVGNVCPTPPPPCQGEECEPKCEPTFSTRTEETFEGKCLDAVRIVKTYTMNSCTEVEVLTSTVRTAAPDTTCPVACEDVKVSSTHVRIWNDMNSGGSSELTWVQQNVTPGPFVALSRLTPGGYKWESNGDYLVVLLKAANQHKYYLNVRQGDVLNTEGMVNNGGQQPEISHVSRFSCPAS